MGTWLWQTTRHPWESCMNSPRLGVVWFNKVGRSAQAVGTQKSRQWSSTAWTSCTTDWRHPQEKWQAIEGLPHSSVRTILRLLRHAFARSQAIWMLEGGNRARTERYPYSEMVLLKLCETFIQTEGLEEQDVVSYVYQETPHIYRWYLSRCTKEQVLGANNITD